jgi:hypothetical protein
MPTLVRNLTLFAKASKIQAVLLITHRSLHSLGHSSTTFSTQLTACLCDMAHYFETEPTETVVVVVVVVVVLYDA